MKDIKAKLKEAREAIKNKDYETSLRLSKEILKEDKTNYMALIFLGLSFQELGPFDQAPRAFQRAAEINPSNHLAWNGLINYYEKIDSTESKNELIKLYSKAVTLEGVDKKIVEYCEKLGDLCDCENIKEISQTIFNCRNKDNVEDNSLIYKIIVNLFKKTTDFPSELDNMYEESLAYLIEKDTSTPEYYSAYLTSLYKKKKHEILFNHAEKMYTLFPTETVSLVWMCKIFNESFVEGTAIAQAALQKVARYYPELLQIEPQNEIGLFSKSIHLLKEGETLQAKEILVEVVAVRPGLLHAWVLLTTMYIKLNLWEEATESSLMASKLLKSMKDQNKIAKDIIDIQSLEILSNSAEEEDWERALELYRTIEDLEEKKKCTKSIIRVNINLQRFAEANLLISEQKSNINGVSTLLLAQLLHKQKKYQEALNLLENASVDECDWWIEIGLLYWDMGEYKKCLVPFLKAAKCNPNNFIPFLHLGNYYQKFEDFDKARRCYEKALKINKKSPQIGNELCKVYRQLKNWEATQNLLENITTGTINAKNSWAWLQLGLNYLEQEDYNNAIHNLRFVVRVQPENVYCWEALADAYLIRGSYTSALKCYEKSLELAESTLYPLLQIANIKKILGHYAEAAKDFEEILLTSGQYVPALKGLAETCMYQARECYRDQRLGTARDLAQVAEEKLILAIQQKSELSCLWKLLADSCLFVAKLPEKYCFMLIPKSFLECQEIEGTAIAEREDLYNVATKSYCKAISLVEDNILIWHDLGMCYLHHAIHTEDEGKVEQLFNNAIAVSQYCTSKNPLSWQHWNLLGNVAMRKNPPNYALAQHSFIKAVSVDHNCAVAWTNLGILYLLKDDIKLANKAFAQGQRSDPNYVNSWIGQALIAEIMGHEEAMDLFRHSTQLGQQQQGGLGYGHWVCQTLLKSPLDANIYSIHNMHAIPVACDALTWYTEKNSYDSCAWNMLGILSERMGLKEQTLKAYKNAYRLSKKEYCDMARINYGRILAKLERYPEAIKIFEEVQEATFNSGSGLALALFKNTQFEESYGAYEQALHWLTEEQSSQSDLLVALASMAYMFQGVDAAKTLLFQSIQLKPPSPWSLYATISLALLHKDLKLARLVSQELEIFKDKKDCLKHYALLKSYAYLSQGKHDKAMKEVSMLIHKYPDNPYIWLTLSLLLLRTNGDKKISSTAAKSAQAAMIFGQTNMDVTKVLCLVSLASFLAGDNEKALISAQKAVHCYPNVAEGWAVLISTLSLIKKENLKSDLLIPMLCHAVNLSTSESLLLWYRKQIDIVK